MTALIALEGVGVRFGREPVLEDVDLAVEPGAFLGIVGPSGSGKTTLLRTLAGSVRPTAGRIVRDRAATIGYVPQEGALLPHLSVAGNIGYGLVMRGWKKAAIARRVEEMLRLLQLDGFGPRSVAQLSGGQKQR